MISFIRVDDRIIHGQILLRWANEYPCDGIIAVNDEAASNPLTVRMFQSGFVKPVYVISKKDWDAKKDFFAKSNKKYFLITKRIEDVKTILVDDGFVPNLVKEVNVGPCAKESNSIELGKHQYLTPNQANDCEAIQNQGYTINFALLQETSIGTWQDFKHLFNM